MRNVNNGNLIDGWIQTTIGQQITLQRGFDITKEDQRPGSIPVVSSAGILSYHDSAKARGPGVVIGRKSNSIGRSYYVPSDYWPHDTTLWVRDFHNNHPRFVYYFFRNLYPRLVNLDVGSENPTLNRNHIHPTTVSWPPLKEQLAISGTLGTLDDKIDANRRMNETLEAIAQAIFKSWFVDFDPVRAKMEGRQPSGLDADTAALFPDSFDNNEDPIVPKGWRWGQLRDLQADTKYAITAGPFGSNLTRDDYIRAGVPVIRGKDLESSDGWFGESEFVFVSQEKADRLAGNTAKPGDVLFTQRGTLGQVTIIPRTSDHKRYIISQSQMKMTCAGWVPEEYVYLFFKQESVIEFIRGNATASGVPHINLGFLPELSQGSSCGRNVK
jgi:type I restriction enzyme S subunit